MISYQPVTPWSIATYLHVGGRRDGEAESYLATMYGLIVQTILRLATWRVPLIRGITT